MKPDSCGHDSEYAHRRGCWLCDIKGARAEGYEAAKEDRATATSPRLLEELKLGRALAIAIRMFLRVETDELTWMRERNSIKSFIYPLEAFERHVNVSGEPDK